jgi:hypothetical protein
MSQTAAPPTELNAVSTLLVRKPPAPTIAYPSPPQTLGLIRGTFRHLNHIDEQVEEILAAVKSMQNHVSVQTLEVETDV